MASQALYRKWRSQRFADLVGQEAAARTLRNAVRSNRIAHAYLFCGPRGVGKTSAARILAKAVNCPQAVDGEPCARCEICLAIQEGRAIDVMEIDAASNRGIDEIRSIREKVGLAPATARYKFYILDEAHMLTVDAFNALLKTLEEPPPNTVFVLVTTEAQRLPDTVLSRCQRLDFRRISIPDAVGRLAFVCQEEGISPEPGVLELLARTAAGSLRDAEGMLDQVVAYAGREPTLAAARSVIGAAGPEAARNLIALLVQGRIEQAIRTVNQLVDEGADPRQIALDVVGCLRDLLLLRTSETLVDLVDASEEALPQLRDLTRRLSPAQIVELIRAFTPNPQARGAIRPQLPLEMAVVEAARILGQPAAGLSGMGAAELPLTRPDAASTRGRRGLPGPAVSTDQPSAPEPVASARNGGPAVDQERPADATGRAGAPPQAGILWSDVRRRWNEVVDTCGSMSRMVQAILHSGRPIAGEEGVIVLGFPYKFHREQIEDQKNRVIVEDAIARVFGLRVRVRCAEASREILAATDPLQAAMEDPLVKAALAMGARVRRVTEESSEET